MLLKIELLAFEGPEESIAIFGGVDSLNKVLCSGLGGIGSWSLNLATIHYILARSPLIRLVICTKFFFRGRPPEQVSVRIVLRPNIYYNEILVV